MEERVARLEQAISSIGPTVGNVEQNLIPQLTGRLAGVEVTVNQTLVSRSDEAASEIKKLQDAHATTVAQLSSIVQRINEEVDSRQKAVNAAIDGMQISVNELEVKVLEQAYSEVANWKEAKAALDAKFESVHTEMTGMGRVVRDSEESLKLLGLEVSKLGYTGGVQTGTKYSKPITEYKVIDKLSKIESDRKEYRQWQEDLKNALEQVAPKIRIVLDAIESKEWGKGEKEEWLAKEETIRESKMIDTPQWEIHKAEMYTLLVEKTRGDARRGSKGG